MDLTSYNAPTVHTDPCIQFQDYDEVNLLAALQALVIYALILLFPCPHQSSIPLLDPLIFESLQQAVYYVAKTGLILHPPDGGIPPHWESWVQSVIHPS